MAVVVDPGAQGHSSIAIIDKLDDDVEVENFDDEEA